MAGRGDLDVIEANKAFGPALAAPSNGSEQPHEKGADPEGQPLFLSCPMNQAVTACGSGVRIR